MRLPWLLCLWPASSTTAWREWPSSGTATPQWQRHWGNTQGPGGRYGHSMTLYGTQVVLFGGRNNEITRTHVPRSYSVGESFEPQGQGADDAPVWGATLEKENQSSGLKIEGYWDPVYECDFLLRQIRSPWLGVRVIGWVGVCTPVDCMRGCVP